MFFLSDLLVFNTLRGGQGEGGLGNYVDVVIDKGFYFLEAVLLQASSFLHTPMVKSSIIIYYYYVIISYMYVHIDPHYVTGGGQLAMLTC